MRRKEDLHGDDPGETRSDPNKVHLIPESKRGLILTDSMGELPPPPAPFDLLDPVRNTQAYTLDCLTGAIYIYNLQPQKK